MATDMVEDIEKHIEDLLKRMGDTSLSPDGALHSPISFNAYREAERLSRIEAIPYLIKVVHSSQSTGKLRGQAYFILGKLGGNTGNARVRDFLCEQLNQEQDLDILRDILYAIRSLDVVYSDAILPFVKNSRWLLRQEAIKALSCCVDEAAEDALIEILSTSTNHFDLTEASVSLAVMGSRRAIPALCRMLEHPKTDTRFAALGALTEIGDSTLMDIFLRMLASRVASDKTAAMHAIARHGNGLAIEPVLKRVESMTARPSGRRPPDELLNAISFLRGYLAEDDRIEKLFDKLKTRRWNKLSAAEQKRLKTEIDFFFEVETAKERMKALVEAVLQENPDKVQIYHLEMEGLRRNFVSVRSNSAEGQAYHKQKNRLLQPFMGQLMRHAEAQADPSKIRVLLKRYLEASKRSKNTDLQSGLLNL